MRSIAIEFDQVPRDDKAAGMRVKRVVRDGRQIRLIELRPDSGDADWCEEGHVGFVIEGALETTIDGTAERLSAGDGLRIPAGRKCRHGSRAIGGAVRLILVDDA